MKNFRTIISQTLISKLGLDATMLSRLNGNEPVCIELERGAEVYIISENEDLLLTFIEIPIKDARTIKIKSSAIIDSFIKDNELIMNLNKDKFIALVYLDRKDKDLESKLLDKLVSFNNLSEIVNS
ncbi:TPA: hypothetical protein ACQ301_004411 [Yersinia enterocolitica]